ncbi:MAG: alkaline phosphatase family protein [Rikenellaceae bacterium]|nr:alkaline phosphatase family protein [Rikenellaceae bacterium]
MTKLFKTILLTAAVLTSYVANAQDESVKPRLVVNIVVSSMHANDLTHYADNFTSGGFARLMGGGAWFTNASFDYMQTTTPVSLATISTGAMPSVHGVVADRWFEYIGNKQISLIDDSKEQSINYSSGSGTYSPRQLSAETIGDALAEYNPQSIIRTIAVEPTSAIIMAGHAGEAYWMENLQTDWTTSSYYTKELPRWISEYNRSDCNDELMYKSWTPLLNIDKYHNSQVICINIEKNNSKKKLQTLVDEKPLATGNLIDVYEQMCYTPAGNTALFAFAKQTIIKNEMGQDEEVDMLNIVLDTPRLISGRYGVESIEYEDMLYRLDRDLEEFLTFTLAQVTDPREVIVTLCSDHGTSPAFNSQGKELERFNVRQAEVITNAFIGSQHGNGDWVLGVIDNAIYLNHNLIYEKGLSIADMQYDVATFVMQLRGVAHAISAEALRSSYFGSGYGRKIQNGFYPRRSGDVIINLMPGWITEENNIRSKSGSMYRYDTHVPLLIYGGGASAAKHTEKVDMTSLATTLAQMLQISTPSAAEGEPLTIF